MPAFPIERWAFLLADEPGAWTKGFDDSAWRPVRVPHDWSVELDFSPECASGTGYLPGGIGWYRAHVPMAALGLRPGAGGAEAAWSGDGPHVRLVFDGVYKNSDVWVNGYHLGGRPSGHTGFSFDVSEIVSYAPDEDLVVSVRVDRTEIADARWYNGAGITRGVRLEVHDAVRVDEHGTTFATLALDDAAATIRIDQVVVSDLAAPVAVQARHELRSLSSDRVHVFETEVLVPAGCRAASAVVATVPDPERWSDDAPHLHRLTSVLTWTADGVARRAEHAEIVGIRTIAFDPDRGLLVNGLPRVLKGVCLHEDAGPFGTAVPADVWLRRLLTLQDAGCNAIRMAHNPHAPELYALCDALGLFVIDEAFDEWESPKNKWWQGHNVYPPKHEGYATHFPDWHGRDLRAMVEQNRNRPSIVAWSIGNEVDYPNDPYASPLFAEMTGNNDAAKPAEERRYDPGRPDVRRLTTIARRLGAIVRAADPTRPVTLAAAFPELSSRTGLLDDLDLIGYNYKEQLYDADHERFPRTPLLGSENGHGYAEWRVVADNDFVAGQFLWTGIDYLGEAHGWPVHGSGAGLLTLAGFPKHGWHLRRSWWSDRPTASLVARPLPGPGEPRDLWSHPVHHVVPASGEIEVLAFTAGGEPRLSRDGRVLPLEFDADGGYLRTVVAADGGPFVLEVRDAAGSVVARDELHPPGEPVRLEAVAWTAPAAAVDRCRAAGIDVGRVLQVECVLRDAQNAIAVGDVEVSARVDGGVLLGLENGDLADVTPYRSDTRRTHGGRLVVFARPEDACAVRLAAGLLPAVTVQG
ncbi:glycoside hydrolase family 2 TIM barrel-domain containing protein [Microbacterium sp. 22242]|uniref:glycoside hydrolase family 2 TIM barrel-domain containing protein n=1 Tax=Microbacterium sp. 22242 TaxID=3453896 RepID=UPI003F85D30C